MFPGQSFYSIGSSISVRRSDLSTYFHTVDVLDSQFNSTQIDSDKSSAQLSYYEKSKEKSTFSLNAQQDTLKEHKNSIDIDIYNAQISSALYLSLSEAKENSPIYQAKNIPQSPTKNKTTAPETRHSGTSLFRFCQNSDYSIYTFSTSPIDKKPNSSRIPSYRSKENINYETTNNDTNVTSLHKEKKKEETKLLLEKNKTEAFVKPTKSNGLENIT
ncbi:hypothetical protein BB559_004992, partial [Furculomyces boomerangus]